MILSAVLRVLQVHLLGGRFHLWARKYVESYFQLLSKLTAPLRA